MGADDFGRRMNSIPKYVVSTTLTDADATWGSTTVIGGDAVAETTELKAHRSGFAYTARPSRRFVCIRGLLGPQADRSAVAEFPLDLPLGIGHAAVTAIAGASG